MSPSERVELAQTYLMDGAFFSAARVLRELADDLEAEGRRRNVALLGPLLGLVRDTAGDLEAEAARLRKVNTALARRVLSEPPA